MIALVTGGSRGIGLAMVKSLKKAGHTVAVVGRSENAPDCDFYIQADLSDRIERSLVVASAVRKFGGLHVLVNNAGSQEGDWDYQIALMLTAPRYLSREAVKYMVRGGHIVNILSTAAFQGARNIAGYVSAKHGLLGLTRAMAVELAPKIHVNAIAPGLTETDMISDMTPERRKLLESITPAGRFGKPEEVAGALMFLIGSEYIYGQTIIVDGGWMVKNG